MNEAMKEQAPIFRNFKLWYVIVLAFLVVQIILYYLLATRSPY